MEKLYEKFIERECSEAFMQVEALLKCDRIPVESEFYKSYFYLFWDRSKPYPDMIKNQIGKYRAEFLSHKPLYNGFDAFLDDAKKHIGRK